MLHAICDFCGEDCNRNALYLTVTPFGNFARYHTDTESFGETSQTKGFVMCGICRVRHKIPNPYELYETPSVCYEEGLDGPNTHTGWVE